MCEKKGVIRACTLMSMQACECPCAYEHVTACGRAPYTCIREHVCVCTCVCTWHSPPPWEAASPSPPWSWLWDARWAHDVFRPQGALSRAGPGSAVRGPDEGLALQRGGHKGSLLPPCPRRPSGGLVQRRVRRDQCAQCEVGRLVPGARSGARPPLQARSGPALFLTPGRPWGRSISR